MENNNQCSHPPCGCPARDGEKYCSVYCQDSVGVEELACACGHRGCVQESILHDEESKAS